MSYQNVEVFLDALYKLVEKNELVKSELFLTRRILDCQRCMGFLESKYDLTYLDDILKLVHVDRLNQPCLVALVRSSYLAKTFLVNWKSMLDKAEKQMMKKGWDHAALLRNLE